MVKAVRYIKGTDKIMVYLGFSEDDRKEELLENGWGRTVGYIDEMGMFIEGEETSDTRLDG